MSRVVGLALCVLVAAVASVLLLRRHPTPRATPRPSGLDVWLADANLRVWVGVPVDAPTAWEAATRAEGGDLVLASGRRVARGDVRAWVVAYPGGELVEQHGPPWNLPPGVVDPETSPRAAGVERLPMHDVDFTGARASVVFGPSRDRRRRYTYSTTVTNRTGVPLRVTRFAAFLIEGDTLRLSTFTNAYFTAAQFIEWYGAPADGWIPPGGAATDANNYGGPRAAWVYFVAGEDGIEHAVGGLFDASSWFADGVQ
jgi:hypothetical protein